jgi:hypothetical protein
MAKNTGIERRLFILDLSHFMRMHRVYISWTFIVNIYNTELVNTTHGFYWRWDVLHAKWHENNLRFT